MGVHFRNNPLLIVSIIRELIIDFRKKGGQTGGAPRHEVEQVSSYTLTGITITENLDHYTSEPWLKKKKQHRKGFYFLWKLRKSKFQRTTPVVFFTEEQWKHHKLA